MEKGQSTIIAVVIVIIIIGAAAYYFGARGGGGGEGPAENELPDQIVFGGPFPLTGPFSYDGQDQQRGATLAIEEINENGGILGVPVTMEVMDAEYQTPDRFRTCVESLVSKGADVLIAQYPSANGYEVPMVAKHKIPLITHEGAADVNIQLYQNPEKYKYEFSAISPTCYYSSVSAPRVFEQLIDSGEWDPPNRKYAIIANEQYYSQQHMAAMNGNLESVFGEIFWEATGIEKNDGWKEYGWEKVYQTTVPVGTTEWGSVLEEIRNKEPAMIILADPVPIDQATFVQQFAQDPTKSLIYAIYGPGIPSFREVAGNAANGVVHFQAGQNPKTERGAEFENKFYNRFGREPGLTAAASMYDQVYLWKKAIERAHSVDPDALVEAMEELEYRGLLGTYDFTENTHQGKWRDNTFAQDWTTRPDGIANICFQIQDGKQVLIGPEWTTGINTEQKFQLPPWYPE